MHHLEENQIPWYFVKPANWKQFYCFLLVLIALLNDIKVSIWCSHGFVWNFNVIEALACLQAVCLLEGNKVHNQCYSPTHLVYYFPIGILSVISTFSEDSHVRNKFIFINKFYHWDYRTAYWGMYVVSQMKLKRCEMFRRGFKCLKTIWIPCKFFSILAIWAATWQNHQNDCARSKDSDNAGHQPIWSVFAMRSMGSLGPKLPSCGQWWPVRLGVCPGWSELSLGAYVILLVCH